MDFIIDEAREELLRTARHGLVTGGPGSGKTTLALLKAEKKITSGLSAEQSVLFLSFSRAAVARIVDASKDRIPKKLQQKLSIQTFHSFFWGILQAYGYLLGAPRRLSLLPPHDERVLRDGAEEESEAWSAERERLFREEGRVAFDLFAPKVHELFSRCEKLRNLFSCKFPLIIVDEAQDTAEDQWQITKLLSAKAQLICLADLDQQIYDFRPGVSAERVTQIMEALSPLRLDLQSQNHRSPASEIVNFGNDILLGTPRGAGYRGVTRRQFRPDRARRDSAIRSSVGMISNQVNELTGSPPQNIAYLATWGRGVAVITRALTGDGASSRIPHRVAIDEAPVFLASRLIAFLLEPKRQDQHAADLGQALDLAAAVFSARGTASSLAQARRLKDQALLVRAGQRLRTGSTASGLADILDGLRSHRFSGQPKRDWIDTRKMLRESGSVWLDIADTAEQLIAFQRGQHIAAALTEIWQSKGTYAGARDALDSAIAQDQLLSGGDDLRGIHVMTLHKSKGKEFDAVIILDDSNSSPLIGRERAPFPRSRKLLRVGITRAKHQVLLLTDLFTPTPILTGHRL